VGLKKEVLVFRGIITGNGWTWHFIKSDLRRNRSEPLEFRRQRGGRGKRNDQQITQGNLENVGELGENRGGPMVVEAWRQKKQAVVKDKNSVDGNVPKIEKS